MERKDGNGAMRGLMQDVTAIVPTYNRARYLGECLEALVEQTTPPRQIIVVDDGSIDDTAAVVARWAGRIEYLAKENGGKSSALNLALSQATGAAIWIFDDDDVAEPDALAKLCAALAAHPEAGFAFGDYDNFTDIDGARRFTAAPPPIFEADDIHFALLERCFIFQPALLVRRACYEAVGSFDTGLIRAQDYEMILRLSRQTAGVHVPHILFHQRQHGEVRGTAAHAIDGEQIWERQKAFDAKVLESFYRANALADYLPRSAVRVVLSPRDEVSALLRRCAVMARKKLWDLAAADMASAATIATRAGIEAIAAADARALGRVFDEYSYARDRLDVDNPLLGRITTLPRGPFRASVRAALLWPLFRYVVQDARQGNLAGLSRHARLYLRLMDGKTPIHHALRLAGKGNATPTRAVHEAG